MLDSVLFSPWVSLLRIRQYYLRNRRCSRHSGQLRASEALSALPLQEASMKGLGIPRQHCRARLAGLFASASLFMLLAACSPSGLYLTDAQVLQLDRTIQKQADENERLRQAVLRECRQ